jgi:UDP:flavonoid glycosyltransferase YjiC (YdhE family)
VRVFLLVMGTRGDFEIFLPLACALRERGHDVLLASSGFYAERAAELEVPFAAVGPGRREELVTLLRSLADLPGHRERAEGYFRRWVRPQLGASLPAIRSEVGRADYVIGNLRSVWTRRGRIVPGANVGYEPPASLESLAKHLPQRVADTGALLELVAMNRALVDPERHWGERYRFTGFWRPAPAPPFVPPPALAGFLAAGPPPVVLTMGSMVTFDAARLRDAFVAALAETGRRGIVVGGWAGIAGGERLPGTVLAVGEAPYDWLLPQAACVAHHGGCGTVAAALRAGVPSIVLPLIGSQQHYADLLSREGLAAGVLDALRPSADGFAAAIRASEGAACRAAARRWRDVVAGDPGVPAAVAAIEEHARSVGEAI